MGWGGAPLDIWWNVSKLEEQLARFAAPSSPTERDKQERAVRMVRNALDASNALRKVELLVIPKGSYPNGTNVRVDSDVDIAVIQRRFFFCERDGECSGLQEQLGYRRSFRYTQGFVKVCVTVRDRQDVRKTAR